MTLSGINIVMTIIVMIVVPIIMGGEICHLFGLKRTVPYCFTLGLVGQWALCQIISVPLVLLKQSFVLVTVLQSLVMIVICVFAITRKHLPEYKIQKGNVMEVVGMIIVAIMTVIIVVPSIKLQLTNADDSRFVVNAVDIVRTNRLLLTDVNTGKEITTWIGDLHKDVASPWPVYVAYLSKVTGIHVATMFHTVLPPILLLMVVAVYWMLGKEFFTEDKISTCIFVIVAILVNIYGGYSIYNSETFMLTRLWQGKSVIAAIGIPLLLLGLIWLFNAVPKRDKWLQKSEDDSSNKANKNYFLILLMVVALGLPSNMGFILTTIMLGSFGLIYGISKKSLKVMFGVWLCCIPSIIYLLISYSIKP